MEKNYGEEQPEVCQTEYCENKGEQNESCLENFATQCDTPQTGEEQPDSKQGSSFGKFNSADELYSAYNNLQAEFTRKCQKLSELTKKGTEQQCEYFCEDWGSKVAQFVTNNEKAKKYAKEIGEVLLSDENIAKSKDSLNLAYQKVLSSKFKEQEELLKDEQFIEKIIKDDFIRDRLLKNALKEVKNSPSVMKSGAISLSKSKSPLSFDEAGKMVLGLFKKEK